MTFRVTLALARLLIIFDTKGFSPSCWFVIGCRWRLLLECVSHHVWLRTWCDVNLHDYQPLEMPVLLSTHSLTHTHTHTHTHSQPLASSCKFNFVHTAVTTGHMWPAHTTSAPLMTHDVITDILTWTRVWPVLLGYYTSLHVVIKMKTGSGDVRLNIWSDFEGECWQ